MARNSDGSKSEVWNSVIRPPIIRISHNELVVDSFAGGGGASTGIEQAIGRHVDIAINHNAEAISMHAANHPHTKHYQANVWKVDPMEATGGKPVALAWFSPDCTYFSKSRGGKPVSKQIRGLAWVAVRWAKTVRPRIICIENVEEFQGWGPVIPKTDKHGNTVFGKDGKPEFIPCPVRKGFTFRRFVNSLKKIGYTVDWRELRACDYGAPTIRKRLFLVARCDGLPIVWPEQTHGEHPILKPYRTAAECIDWNLCAPSIFSRKKPLVDATMKRIANGLRKFVFETDSPYILDNDRAAWVIKHFGGATGCRADVPFPTILSRGTQNQIVTANIIRHFGQSIGSNIRDPLPTITAGGMGKSGIIISNMMKLRGTCRHGQALDLPAPTITAGGNHLAQVNAFLVKYVASTDQRINIPSCIGDRYAVADIGMRMLQPKELYRCQGFPDSYVIDTGANGEKFTKTAQVRMVGNSVSPYVAKAIAQANIGIELGRKYG